MRSELDDKAYKKEASHSFPINNGRKRREENEIEGKIKSRRKEGGLSCLIDHQKKRAFIPSRDKRGDETPGRKRAKRGIGPLNTLPPASDSIKGRNLHVLYPSPFVALRVNLPREHLRQKSRETFVHLKA